MLGLFLLLVLLVSGAWSALYTVPSDSVAVVRRFGRYIKEVKPGLHFKLPYGIDVATIVPVKRQLKQGFGFATPGATNPWQGLISSRHCRKRFPAVQLRQPLEIGRQRGIQVLFPKSPSPVSLCLTGPIHAGFSPHSE
jgi:hypothetical protein